MIVRFKHKGLAELFDEGATAKIAKTMQVRCLERLDVLENATTPGDMRIPGYDFHPLRGHKPVRYSVHVNGPWCITFEFDGMDATHVDFEQYH